MYNHRFVSLHFFPRIHLANELEYNCDKCDFYCQSEEEFLSHYVKYHRKTLLHPINTKNIKKLRKPQVFNCTYCQKKFKSKCSLRGHLKFHEPKKFVCIEHGCIKKFSIKLDLEDHVRKAHTLERPFLCKFCGKKFLTKPVYYQHRLTHYGDRRHKCGVCEKAYYRWQGLHNHLLFHTGEKKWTPYPPKKKFSF